MLDILEIEDLNVDGIHPNEIGHKKLFERIKEENDRIGREQN